MSDTTLCHQLKLISFLQTPLKLKGKIHPRSQFTSAEDEKLINLVNQYGDDNWEDIAALMKNRNVRQCKERWLNYLDPNVKNSPWTQEEDDLLEDLFSKYGPKWVKISQMLDGRTDINVKNRFLLIQRRKKRNEKKLAKIQIENKNEKKDNCQIDEKLKYNYSQKNELFPQFFDEIIDSSFDAMNEWDLFNFDY